MTDTQPLPDIPLVPVKSSNVMSVGYDATTMTVRVRFRNGATYRYAGVAPEIHESIVKSPSVGAAISKLRGSHPATREP